MMSSVSTVLFVLHSPLQGTNEWVTRLCISCAVPPTGALAVERGMHCNSFSAKGRDREFDYSR